MKRGLIVGLLGDTSLNTREGKRRKAMGMRDRDANDRAIRATARHWGEKSADDKFAICPYVSPELQREWKAGRKQARDRWAEDESVPVRLPPHLFN